MTVLRSMKRIRSMSHILHTCVCIFKPKSTSADPYRVMHNFISRKPSITSIQHTSKNLSYIFTYDSTEIYLDDQFTTCVMKIMQAPVSK